MKTITLTILLLTVPGFGHSFDRGETELLNLAYREGSKIGQPEALQAIMLNESWAGRWGRHGDKNFKSWKRQCYGVMQVQFHTARFMVDRYTNHKLSDKKLRLRLQYDDAFNVKVARIYLKHLLEFFGGTLDKAILAYNTGPGNVQRRGLEFDPNNYLAKAKRRIRMMYKFNHEQGNGQAITYIVKKHDTLFLIAQRILSNGWRWKEILNSNPGILPRKLEIGSKLLIRK